MCMCSVSSQWLINSARHIEIDAGQMRNSMNSDFYVESEKMHGSGLFTTAVPYSSNPDKICFNVWLTQSSNKQNTTK
ncbi:hypothetical protein ANCDUO_07322 [Ancylostoma duodenale]|uniref:Uncharacterized protein n=1 Tax=Ancylostoma duodenale TaxID=51022 RepID=A0A0C2GMF3_9BILA|nr:hypothetical protein ANCDUO_07322 [Ancylostoma duodenale]